MRNYWYAILSNKYAHIENDKVLKSVKSVQYQKKYIIMEMSREATKKEMDKYSLLYCGFGVSSQKHIRVNTKKYY
ncbi:hypothetical protein [Enterococcus faecium]|uniref:hypothetical protein n=1 Tax=Enterococcus faecium TaxID=1352 RepID=UPI0023B2A963|nr:hypothetical protein [Enterococcus faecium]